MNYFNQILDGNIPVNVLEIIEGFSSEYAKYDNFQYYNINQHMPEYIYDYKASGDGPVSPYGAYVKASLRLDRDKVGLGLMNVLKIAITKAYNKSKQNIQQFYNDDSVVNQIYFDFTQEIINIINEMTFDNNMKELLIHIMNLIGITTNNKQQIEESRLKIIMIMELHQEFKIYKTIDIVDSIKKHLSQENLNKCEDLTRKCVFNDKFLFNFTIGILIVLEHVLGSIMNESKQHKICEFYAFSVELSNQLAQLAFVEQQVQPAKINKIRNIEHFTERPKKEQKKMIENLSKILNKSINDIFTKNSADLLRVIAISQTIDISGAEGQSFNFSNISQSSEVNSDVNADFVQNITNKIQNDITNDIVNNIDVAIEEYTKNVKETSINEKITEKTKLSMIDKAGTALASSIGNSFGGGRKKRKKLKAKLKEEREAAEAALEAEKAKADYDFNNKIKNMFDVNKNFNYKSNNDAETEMNNILSTEYLSQCANNTDTSSKINLSNITVDSDINITDIEQKSVVNDIMKCAFTQEVINDISSKALNDFDNLFKLLDKEVNDNLSKTNKTLEKKKINKTYDIVGEVLGGVGKGAGAVGKSVGSGGGIFSQFKEFIIMGLIGLTLIFLLKILN